MEYKIIEKENWERLIEINVQRNEIEHHFEQAYQEARPMISHKGFRKGQMPLNLIKKIYGRQIEADAMGNIANELFNQVLTEKKISFIGEPAFEDLKINDNDYSFSFSYEIMPEFNLADYQDINIDEPVHRVTEEEIQKELDEIAINNGNVSTAEQITDELHIANVTIREVDDESGKVLIDAKSEQTEIFLHSPYVAPDLRSLLLNLKVNDDFNYQPRASDPSAPNKTFNIQINNIMKLTPVEITDAFVATYTQGKFTTVDDFKEEIGFKIQEYWDEKSRNAMEEQLVKKLVDMHDFSVPNKLLFKVVEGMTDELKIQYKNNEYFQNITAEMMFDDLKPAATQRLKWEIVRAKIIEKEDIKVEDFDLDDLVEKEAQRRKLPAETIKKEFENNRQIIEQILSKKVMDLLLDYAVTHEVEFDEHGHYHPEGEEHHHHHEHEDDTLSGNEQDMDDNNKQED